MSSIFDVVYIFKADIYCDECGEELQAKCDNALIVDNKDSDHYPQAHSIGEADIPQHCGSCGEFLENPLTTDGYNYVRDLLARNPESEVVKQWATYYQIDNERN